MDETLMEYCDSRGSALRVDRVAGVIRGIKILGLRSRNGREYLGEALRKARPLYEGAKVNVNHPKTGNQAPRDYQDRIGVIRGVELRTGEGLFGDLHFNPKHALAEQLIWDAEHAPDNVGLSHNVVATTAQREGVMVVEEIRSVQSVDLVADPATTRGLFESAEASTASEAVDVASGVVSEPTVSVDLFEQLCHEQAEEIQRLREQIERLEQAVGLGERREKARQLLLEHGLPDQPSSGAGAVVSETFFETLLATSDTRAMKQLVGDRAALVREAGLAPGAGWQRGVAPKSREQNKSWWGADEVGLKQFVRAITS